MNDEIQDIQTGRKPQILIKLINKKMKTEQLIAKGVKAPFYKNSI
jgi:hypothetical protein